MPLSNAASTTGYSVSAKSDENQKIKMTIPDHDMQPSLADQQDRDDVDLLGLLDTVIEARWLIAGITAVILFFGILYAFLNQPVYPADSLIQVDKGEGPARNEIGKAKG